jgi:putative intracellular protease/amidase
MENIKYASTEITRRQFTAAGFATTLAGLASSVKAGIASEPSAGESSARVVDLNTTVTILLFPGVTLLDAIGPYEMLHRVPGFEVRFVAERIGPVLADSGLVAVDANASIGDVDQTDVLLIPGGGIGVREASENANLMRWIREIDRRSIYTTSVCTGSLILARAGFLSGRKATTHFALKEMLNGLGAEYVAERWVRSDKYWTAAGVSAGLDMSLALIADIEGDERAMITQLAVEYDPHPPFRSGSEGTAAPDILEAYRQRR